MIPLEWLDRASTTAPYETGVGSHPRRFLEDILPNIKYHKKLCRVFLCNGPGTVSLDCVFSSDPFLHTGKLKSNLWPVLIATWNLAYFILLCNNAF